MQEDKRNSEKKEMKDQNLVNLHPSISILGFGLK